MQSVRGLMNNRTSDRFTLHLLNSRVDKIHYSLWARDSAVAAVYDKASRGTSSHPKATLYCTGPMRH